MYKRRKSLIVNKMSLLLRRLVSKTLPVLLRYMLIKLNLIKNFVTVLWLVVVSVNFVNAVVVVNLLVVQEKLLLVEHVLKLLVAQPPPVREEAKLVLARLCNPLRGRYLVMLLAVLVLALVVYLLIQEQLILQLLLSLTIVLILIELISLLI